VDELRHKLETTESTRPEAIIEPYNYTKKTLDLTAVTELDFRITDPAGALGGPGGSHQEKKTTRSLCSSKT